eukprot:TRINITY_DN29767_c0_g1_i1.p1 TRINITY_DN29767_c0_g1~~TRINITY_DN29767_c0_g1_i1.p1  ORF type:complete len:490 (-),score=109.25 TRINITY_DN29767_c0_g1_i1:59-1381(-)
MLRSLVGSEMCIRDSAPIYVRPIDSRTGDVQEFAAFEWAEPAEEVLAWEARRPKLLTELQQSNADLICLQEVQFEPTEAGGFGLPAWLSALDKYKSQLPDQSSLTEMAERNERVLAARYPVGNAVLYNPERLELLPGVASDSTTRVCVCVRGKGDLSGLSDVAVFSAHLDATSEEKRVKQLAKCMEVARARGLRHMLIAGDLNSELNLGSCAAAILAEPWRSEPSEGEMAAECAGDLRLDGEAVPSPEQLETWYKLHGAAAEMAELHRVRLLRVPTEATRACFEIGKRAGPCVPWRLDHILYSPQVLQLRSRWQTLEVDPQLIAVGLPNHSCPSDHLPIAASFEPVQLPVLDDAGKSEVERRLVELDQVQLGQVEALVASQMKVQLGIEAEEAAAAAESPAAAEPVKGRGKNKKGKPSAQMIAFIPVSYTHLTLPTKRIV